MLAQSLNLNPVAREKCAELLRETGHKLTIDDHPQLARLSALADRVTSAEDKAEQSLLDMPVTCGNVTLSKPNMGKLYWFNECAVRWFADEPALREFIFLYLLSTPNEKSTVQALNDRESTAFIVGAWAKQLTATEREVEQALARVYPGQQQDDDSDGEPVAQGPVFALLAKEYGETPEWWMWTPSVAMVQTMLADYSARIDAEHKAQRKATGGGYRKGGSAQPTAPAVTPSVRNMARLRDYTNALRKRWSERAA